MMFCFCFFPRLWYNLQFKTFLLVVVLWFCRSALTNRFSSHLFFCIMEDDLFLNSVQYQQKVERLRVGRFSELNSEWPPAAVRGSCLYQHLRPYSCNFPFSVRMYLLCLFLAVQHHQRRHARTFSMASVAFDSRWQCWLLLIYLFMYLYLFVFCCGCQAEELLGKNEQQSSGRR